MKRVSLIGVLALGLGAATPFLAQADISPAAPKARAPSPSPRVPDAKDADDRHSLRRGVVTGVSKAGDQIEIQGHWHRIDPVHTRILRGGQAASKDAIKVGQTLEFTLLPGREAQRGLGVVYVR